jgi:hypothetical protein
MTMQQITGRERQGAVHAPEGVAAGAMTADVFVPQTAPARGVSTRTMEIATSLAFALAGVVAIWDSARLGAGWSADGPQSGYFPLWIGVFLVAASALNLVLIARATARHGEDAGGGEAPIFLTWQQAKTVSTVFIPTAVYVAVIPFIGIYVASAVLVAWFMVRLGEFSLLRAVPAGAATALITFVVFEMWFLVALPKGPLEDFLGY